MGGNSGGRRFGCTEPEQRGKLQLKATRRGEASRALDRGGAKRDKKKRSERREKRGERERGRKRKRERERERRREEKVEGKEEEEAVTSERARIESVVKKGWSCGY